MLKDEPEGVQPYLFHGVGISGTSGDENYTGDCPFCNRADKFGVRTVDHPTDPKCKAGMYQCWKCGESGNATMFLQWLWKESRESTSLEHYRELAADRKLLSVNTLMRWEVARSVLDGHWLIPGYSVNRNLVQLYSYRLDRKTGRHKLYTTPKGCGHGHQLFGRNLYQPRHSLIYLCEGPWDAMALWEVLRGKPIDVLAVPGCSTLPKSFLPLLSGVQVCLLYDSDHPRTHGKSGEPVPPVGYRAMQRVVKTLAAMPTPPTEVSYLNWGEEGYDPNRPSGYDIRDYLTDIGGDPPPKEGKNRAGGRSIPPSDGRESPESPLAARLRRWETLKARITPVPEEWLSGPARASQTIQPDEGVGLDSTPCSSYKQLIQAWRKALKWTEGLDVALSVMLAAVAGTRQVGDQLWVKIISPPSAGKTTLCEALSVNREHVFARSTIRGFHSGYKEDGKDGEDNSLIPHIRGKTLATKDGDTLLQSPNLSQILSEARDIYDGTSRTHYRNKMGKTYEGIRTTWILCGTKSLRRIDSSELGERFLDCLIMDEVNVVEERDIIRRRLYQENRNMSLLANGDPKNRYSPELVEAMELTGGYISTLCSTSTNAFERIEVCRSVMERFIDLGQFVACMRSRPGPLQSDSDSGGRELGTRLGNQHLRLAKGLALVLNKTRVCPEVMCRVRKVGLDTSRGETLEITKLLYNSPKGLEARAIHFLTKIELQRVGKLLRFLFQIGVAERAKSTGYRLTEWMRNLYSNVMGE